MENRFCKKCLLDKVFGDAEYKHMQQYIEAIDENIKVEKIQYKERLEKCLECENLINGMCKLCGCFVEIRAAIYKNYCPDKIKKW